MFIINVLVIFHLQSLQNIGYIPHVVTASLQPVLYPEVCTSYSPTLVFPLPPTGKHQLFSVSVSLLFCCYIHQYGVFFRFHIEVIRINIYLWLHCIFFAAHRLSLVAGSRVCSPAAVHRLLITVVSLAAEHRLQAHRLQQLWHVGLEAAAHDSRAPAQQLRCMGLVVLQHVGSSRIRYRTRPLAWQVDSSPEPLGKPKNVYF